VDSLDCGAHFCYIEVLLSFETTFFFLTIECNRGGAKASERCPVQPCDLVLLHNLVMEALAQPDDHINDDFDFWNPSLSNNPNAACHLKDLYLKYCKAYEKRVKVVLEDYRIIPEDEEQPTSTMIKGLITEWTKRTPMFKQKASDVTMELQFLEVHKKQYLELSADFAKIRYTPKTKTALANMKELILLDLRILLGADIPWSRSPKQPEHPPSVADGQDALPEAASGDDKSTSGAEEAAPDAAAAAAAVDATEPDTTNFLTWKHGNWDAVAFDEIHFPAGMNPHKTKAYYAVAVIFLNSLTLRTKHSTVWSELTAAWLDTFGVPLNNETLGTPPAAGPNAFSEEEREWCAQTLRFFSAGGAERAPSQQSTDRRLSSRVKRSAGIIAAAAGGSSATPAAARRIAPSTSSAG